MSRYAIMKEFDGDTYVYDMIRNLCQSHHILTVSRKLCVIEDLANLIEKSDFKYKIIRQLDRDLHLGYGIRNEEERNYSSLVKIRILKTRNESTLIIRYSSNPPLLIKLKSNNDVFVRASHLFVLEEIGKEWESGQQYDVSITKDSSGNHVIYYYLQQKSAVATTDYLDARTGNQNEELVLAKNVSSMKDKDNGQNLFYELNFRGFLLFLFNLSKLRLKKSDIQKQICEVLSNPKTEEIAPFLKYWKDFKNAGFDVLHSLNEIAAELQNHHEDNTTGLSSSNMVFLIRRATEIYFIRVTNYFFLTIDISGGFSYHYGEKKGFANLQEIRRKASEYRLFILSLLKGWYSEDLKAIDELIETYHNGDV